MSNDSQRTGETASILAIGEEILSGRVLNTNGKELAKSLEENGYRVILQSVVSDIKQEILEALQTHSTFASTTNHLIIVIGGLGPTVDDVTRDAVAEWLGRGFETDHNWKRILHARYGSSFSALDNQSQIIQGSQVVENPNGSALGLILPYEKGSIVLLPGPPMECLPVFQKVLSFIPKGQKRQTASFRVVGINEVEVDLILRQQNMSGNRIDYGIYPAYGYVDVVFSSPLCLSLESVAKDIQEKVSKDVSKSVVFLPFQKLLEGEVVQQCKKNGWTLATCESCTGGRVAAKITAIPGSSSVFLGSYVAYSEKVKQRLLHIEALDIQKYGVVSEEISQQMARSAQKLIGADVVCSTTGYFGPTGGTHSNDPPVGTAFITILTPKSIQTFHFYSTGQRETIAAKCTGFAISHLLCTLVGT